MALDCSTFHDIVQTEAVFRAMRNTVEDGPFHREPNVFVHTMMVVAEYKSMVDTSSDWYDLGLFACLLHDIAKPVCKVRKTRPERGDYWAFDKHDIVGADLAVEILCKYPVSEFDIYRIAWMISNHQIFWSAKNKDKRAEMARALRSQDLYLPFKFFMLADERGRICDERNRDCREHFKTFEAEFGFTKWL